MGGIVGGLVIFCLYLGICKIISLVISSRILNIEDYDKLGD